MAARVERTPNDRMYITHCGILSAGLLNRPGWRFVKARETPRLGLVAFSRAKRAP